MILFYSNPVLARRVAIAEGFCLGVAVSGQYAFVATEDVGLIVIDVSTPTNPVRVGRYDTPGYANGVAAMGNFAYVADSDSGLQVIDVSNPPNFVLMGSYNTSGRALGVTVVANRIYVADGPAGLLVLPSLPNVQLTVRVDATPDLPFTLEAATNLSDPNPWQPLLTTNVAAMPFDFVDFDVKLSDKPRKFYRVRQP